MQFDASPLALEVKSVVEAGPQPVHFEWRAVLQVLPVDNPQDQEQRQAVAVGSFEALKVISCDILRDYGGSKFTEEVFVKLLVGGGVYAHHLYPCQNRLVISLYQYPLNEIGDIRDISKPTRAVSYRAVLKDRGAPEIQQDSPQPLSTRELDLANQVELEFQLIDYAVEILRTVMLNTNVRQANVKDTLVSLITETCQKTDLKGGNPIQGVTMAEPNNTEVYEQIVIPVGTHLVKLPDHIQRAYGVYSAGMGYFIQDGFWYIWPQFNTGKFETAFNPITVIMVPPKRMPGIERTYRQDGDAYTILATGESHYRESSEAQQIQAGVGTRFIDGRRVMEDFTKDENGKITAKRSETSTEVIATERPNGVNYTPYATQPITANPYAEFSKLAQRDGNIIALNWENSDPNVLKPGMPMRVKYMGTEQIETLEGVLQKAHHYIHMDGVGMTSKRHRSNTTMFIYVKRTTEDNLDAQQT